MLQLLNVAASAVESGCSSFRFGFRCFRWRRCRLHAARACGLDGAQLTAPGVNVSGDADMEKNLQLCTNSWQVSGNALLRSNDQHSD